MANFLKSKYYCVLLDSFSPALHYTTLSLSFHFFVSLHLSLSFHTSPISVSFSLYISSIPHIILLLSRYLSHIISLLLCFSLYSSLSLYLPPSFTPASPLFITVSFIISLFHLSLYHLHSHTHKLTQCQLVSLTIFV